MRNLFVYLCVTVFCFINLSANAASKFSLAELNEKLYFTKRYASPDSYSATALYVEDRQTKTVQEILHPASNRSDQRFLGAGQQQLFVHGDYLFFHANNTSYRLNAKTGEVNELANLDLLKPGLLRLVQSNDAIYTANWGLSEWKNGVEEYIVPKEKYVRDLFLRDNKLFYLVQTTNGCNDYTAQYAFYQYDLTTGEQTELFSDIEEASCFYSKTNKPLLFNEGNLYFGHTIFNTVTGEKTDFESVGFNIWHNESYVPLIEYINSNFHNEFYSTMSIEPWSEQTPLLQNRYAKVYFSDYGMPTSGIIDLTTSSIIRESLYQFPEYGTPRSESFGNALIHIDDHHINGYSIITFDIEHLRTIQTRKYVGENDPINVYCSESFEACYGYGGLPHKLDVVFDLFGNVLSNDLAERQEAIAPSLGELDIELVALTNAAFYFDGIHYAQNSLPESFSIQDAPSWVTIEPSTGHLSADVQGAAGEQVSFTVTAENQYGESSPISIILNLITLDIAEIVNTESKTGEQLLITPNIETSTERVLYHLENAPNWLIVDPITGAISGTPNEAGTYEDIKLVAESRNVIVKSNSFKVTISGPTIKPDAEKSSGTFYYLIYLLISSFILIRINRKN